MRFPPRRLERATGGGFFVRMMIVAAVLFFGGFIVAGFYWWGVSIYWFPRQWGVAFGVVVVIAGIAYLSYRFKPEDSRGSVDRPGY